MRSFILKDLKPSEAQNYLQHAIAPRPICFASTIDAEGNHNLSPFSFFNLFSSNPPICIFSPARRVRDNTTKHTLQNVQAVKEVVINMVTYDMVQQTSLASTEYAKGVNEFEKSGFTMLKSDLVKPMRVAESPVQMECIVRDIISLGNEGGAGNLVLAEIIKMHISESILKDDGTGIDQTKLDLVARLGGDWYARVTPESLFHVAKPLTTLGIGVDNIPSAIRNSNVLTGNNLGQLGNVEKLPSDEEIDSLKMNGEIKEIFDAFIGDKHSLEIHLHKKAKELLDKGEVHEAWKILLAL
ncbi:flavin reductase family protein [Solitalea koreensis]|uniref:NADH-FMN oxidoreductase RutF, flavin reductase (DIM6/NTAB) family n=1 Tax=Solitalea koreensis TaxID=543615 RepID=A0A521CYB3_9SPHI|nr:flavin reductase family protein [Solitalea koreensis]SMO64414.1 NADH-FMN oxidoreductase RutF, flavin reductase (DIM6/NTAB) family [Solitalea koreensis]